MIYEFPGLEPGNSLAHDGDKLTEELTSLLYYLRLLLRLILR